MRTRRSRISKIKKSKVIEKNIKSDLNMNLNRNNMDDNVIIMNHHINKLLYYKLIYTILYSNYYILIINSPKVQTSQTSPKVHLFDHHVPYTS